MSNNKAMTQLRRLKWSFAPPSRPKDTVSCHGPNWFRRLVADSYEIDGEPGACRIAWRDQTDPDDVVVAQPFVSPTRSNPVSRRRLPRRVPRAIRELDRDARGRSRHGLDPSVVGMAAARENMVAYRQAHQSAINLLVGRSVSDQTGPSVLVCCVSKRPHRLAAVIDQFHHQQHDPSRLVIVSTVELTSVVRVAVNSADRVQLIEVPGHSLGAALNTALSNCDEDLFAKWDDDDWYGPNYLGDLILAWRATGAAVVGKHSSFAYLPASDQTILRFPRQTSRDTSYVAGGTLLIDRRSIGDTQFPDVDLGEDSEFLRSCWAGGLRLYAADPFNYVQLRGDDNTWSIADNEFARESARVGEGLQLEAAFT